MRLRYHGNEMTGRLLDLSPTGGWMVTPEPLSLGAKVLMTFDHPQDGRRVRGEGPVVRQVAVRSQWGNHGVGVEFDSALLDLGEPITYTAPRGPRETSRPASPTPAPSGVRPARCAIANIPVEFEASGQPPETGSLNEISLRGIRIAAKAAPSTGARITVRALAPKTGACPAVEIVGTVRWARFEHGGYAFEVAVNRVVGGRDAVCWNKFVLVSLGLLRDE